MRQERPRRDEAGAVALTVGAMVLVLVLIAALAIDIGMQRVARSDMQSLADVVALDLARELDGSKVSALQGPLEAQAQEALLRNSGTIGDVPQLEVLLGAFDVTTGDFDEMDSDGVPTAVRVFASTSVDFAIATGSGGATRGAVATRAVPGVCFSVGTKTLSLDTDSSALSPLLMGLLAVDLDGIGYEGVVDLQEASIPVADLLAELNVGSVEGVATTNVTFDELVLAAAEVARAQGDTATVEVLEALALSVPGIDFVLGDILALGTAGPVSSVTGDLNVLDLLTAGVVAANGENAIAVDVPGLLELTIIEPPQIACGSKGATARSAQIALSLEPQLVDTLGLGLLESSTALLVQVGRAVATIDADLSCDVPEKVTITTQTGAVTIDPPVPPKRGQVGLTVSFDDFLSAIPGLGYVLRGTLRLLGLSEVDLDVLLSGSIASATETTVIEYPEAPALPETFTVPEEGIDSALTLSAAGVFMSSEQGGLVAALGGLLTSTLDVLLNSVARPVVNDLLNPLLTAILNGLEGLLGLKLGVADVKMLGRPVCNAVQLVD